MSYSQVYRINNPTIIHEIIEGEAVIINMEMGHYYSIDQTGAGIWELVDKRASTAEIIESITQGYAGDPKTIQSSVLDFLAELQHENLIVPASKQTDEQTYSGNIITPTERPPFTPPELHKYIDMQDLLLLDPIHEVDESGWPNVGPDINQP
jgi:hypothetical protein